MTYMQPLQRTGNYNLDLKHPVQERMVYGDRVGAGVDDERMQAIAEDYLDTDFAADFQSLIEEIFTKAEETGYVAFWRTEPAAIVSAIVGLKQESD